jgi:hypothetical protein
VSDRTFDHPRPTIRGASQLATNMLPINAAAVAIVRTTVIRLPSIGLLQTSSGRLL